VTTDGVWIGNWTYWRLTDRNYSAIIHKLCSSLQHALFSRSSVYPPVVAWWRIPTMSPASVLTFLPADDCPTTNSFGRSVELLLAFASTVIPSFSLLEIHDKDFYSLLDMCVFRNGASSSTKERSVFLCRHCVCCTVVSARIYLRCHGVQITVDSVHPLSLHYIK
jgi:hypothetical protein